MDDSDQVFYGFVRGSDGLVPVCPGFDGAPNDLRGGDLLPAGDPRNALPRFVVQSQCQRRCHGVTFAFMLAYYAVYYKGHGGHWWTDGMFPIFPEQISLDGLAANRSANRTGRHTTAAVVHGDVGGNI